MVFLGKSVLKIWSKVTGEHPRRSVISATLLKSHFGMSVLSCKFAAYFQNTFRHPVDTGRKLTSRTSSKRLINDTSGGLLFKFYTFSLRLSLRLRIQLNYTEIIKTHWQKVLNFQYRLKIPNTQLKRRQLARNYFGLKVQF